MPFAAVLVNPIGGNKQARTVFEQEVLPSLTPSCVVQHCITTHAGHAAEVASKLVQADCVDGLLLMGGDGFVHEVLNGIRGREDALAFLRSVPLCILPCGTGNGLATSLNILSVDDGVRLLLSGANKTRPLDLFDVITPQSTSEDARWTTVCWSCLSVTWGVVADHDVISERTLRGWPTFVRLTVAPIMVIFKVRVACCILTAVVCLLCFVISRCAFDTTAARCDI